MKLDQIQKERVKQQIDQMTRSVKTLNEKEIKGVTDQLIRDQMGREEVHFKRENFLQGNGHTLYKGLSDRIEHAAVGTPIEKKPENKAQKKMNRRIRRQYNAMRKEMRADETAQRRELEQEEKYNFIHSESFASPYQYDALADARNWMMENPEAYAQNKEAVDAMYKDLYIADEAYGAMVREARYYQFMDKQGDAAMEREADRRSNVLSDRLVFLEHRLNSLSAGLKALLRGTETSDLVKETLQEYKDIGPTGQQEQEKAVYVEGVARYSTMVGRIKQALIPEIMKQRAVLEERMGWKRSTPEELEKYAQDVYSSAEGRAQNFADVEDAEQVTKVAKLIVYRASEARKAEKGELKADVEASTEAMKYIQEFTTGNMDAMLRVMGDDPLAFVEKYRKSDELLLHDRDQFELLGLRMQHASDLMKTYNDIVNGNGNELIRDTYVREHNITADKLGAMRNMLYSISRKARFLALIQAYKEGVLTADMLSPIERFGYENYTGDELVSQILEKAEHQLAVTDQTLDMAVNTYKMADAREKENLRA